MRILICDDNPMITDELSHLLNVFFENRKLSLPEILTFHSGDDLMSYTDTADILFLDIEMPGRDGLYIGKYFAEKNKNLLIIVVTSYNEYLDDALRFHAFRYLSKPIDRQRFFRNLDDAIKEIYRINTTSSTKLSIISEGKNITLNYNDILYIEVFGHKTIVSTFSDKYTTSESLQYWLSILPDILFVQTHRSFIVNMRHIKSYDRSNIYLLDTSSSTICLSRSMYKSFKTHYLLFLESTL